jgi:hypothetical protein
VLLSGSGARTDAWGLLNVGRSPARGKLVLVADGGQFKHQAPSGGVTAILREASREGARVP